MADKKRETYNLASSQTRACKFCGAENPLEAYCCLHCYKVLRPKYQLPWWRKHIQMSTPMVIGMLGFAFLIIFVFKKWIDGVEAQVNMSIKTNDYNIAFLADKRKKEVIPDVHAERTDVNSPAVDSTSVDANDQKN